MSCHDGSTAPAKLVLKMSEIDDLVERYHAWLRDRTAWKQTGKWVEITAPYLDRNNDYLQVYLRKGEDGFDLTDDGATIAGLEAEGCSLASSKRRTLLRTTLAGYGVTEVNGALTVHATGDNFPLKKHSLVQAMLAVGDMFYLAEPHIASLFVEDVRTWLDASDVRFSEHVSFMGRSGFARSFDFLIPRSRNAPERIVRTINNPARHAADSVIVDWMDTREARPKSSKLFAIVNDNEKEVSSAIVDALTSYEITPVLWSRRADATKALAA